MLVLVVLVLKIDGSRGLGGVVAARLETGDVFLGKSVVCTPLFCLSYSKPYLTQKNYKRRSNIENQLVSA